MRAARLVGIAIALVAVVGLCGSCVESAPEAVFDRFERYDEVRALPPPEIRGSVSVEQALEQRRSVREFTSAELSLKDIGQLFWAAQGLTDDFGHRTAPSAGARYPLEIYALAAGEVMHYLPEGHEVEVGSDGGRRDELGTAAFSQTWINDAPIVFVITGVVSRTEAEYGAIAGRLMDREAGHVAQNLLLEAISLGLGSVPVGGFDPHRLGEILSLSPGEEILYLVPVGHLV